MSLADTQKLTAMTNSIPTQVAAATSGLGAIQGQIDNLTSQISAVTEITDTTTNTAESMIEDIKDDKGGTGILYGPNFGQVSPVGNLTDWAILSGIIPIYWYNPGEYPDLDVEVDDFSFSADLIAKPFPSIDDIASGAAATYGFGAQLELLDQGKSILENNLSKLEGATDVFDRYSS